MNWLHIGLSTFAVSFAIAYIIGRRRQAKRLARLAAAVAKYEQAIDELEANCRALRLAAVRRATREWCEKQPAEFRGSN